MLVPISMVGMVILMEYITLLAPYWERFLFYGRDRKDITVIQSLGDHLLTRSDLSQFLEIVTATICDLLQVKGAFIAMMDGHGLEMLTTAGDDSAFKEIETSDEVLRISIENGVDRYEEMFFWNGHLLIPVIYDDPQNGEMILGLCGFPWEETKEMEEEHVQSLNLLTYRVGLRCGLAFATTSYQCG